MGMQQKRELISYLRIGGELKGFAHRRHRTKKRKNSNLKKLKVHKIKEKELINEINEY